MTGARHVTMTVVSCVPTVSLGASGLSALWMAHHTAGVVRDWAEPTGSVKKAAPTKKLFGIFSLVNICTGN